MHCNGQYSDHLKEASEFQSSSSQPEGSAGGLRKNNSSSWTVNHTKYSILFGSQFHPVPEHVKIIVPTYVSRTQAGCWRHVNAFLCYPPPSLLKSPFSPYLGCTTGCTSAFPTHGCCSMIPTFLHLLSLPHFLQNLFLQHQFQENHDHHTSLSWKRHKMASHLNVRLFTRSDLPFQVLHVTNAQLFKQSKVWLKWEKLSWASLRFSS